MYAQANDSDCPVQSYKKYLSKLHPDCNAFYQQPRQNVPLDDNSPWYENSPLGVNKLNNFMKTMSHIGGLSQMYTNHCMRKTCVSALAAAGYEAKDIQTVTGHKSIQSLASYLDAPTLSKKKNLSSAIHVYGKKTKQTHTVTFDETSALPVTEMAPAQSSTVEQNILRPISNCSQNSTNVSSQNVCLNLSKTTKNIQESLNSSLLGGSSFHNCTFHMNFGKL